MKSFYKYIICFLLGIIIFYLLFKENNIEGIVFDQDPSQLNRGCSHYTCKNDPSKYDNYQTKIYSSGTAPSEYNNCLPISEQEIYHKRGTDEDHQPLSEGPVNLCTNDICCENFICSENAENITCPDGQMFLPNNKCVHNACDYTRCCSDLHSEGDNFDNLFDEIIEFRDNHGGKNNGQYITGEDILFYLYNSFLDIKQMSEVLVPLEFDAEKFPDTDVLDTLQSNINTILGKDYNDNNTITDTYSDNDYKNKPVFFNNDAQLVLEFDNDNCSYDLSTRSKFVNNKEDYFPQDCIGYKNKIERYAFYKNISSYDKNVSLRLKDIFSGELGLESMATFLNEDLFYSGKRPYSGLFEQNGYSVCGDIDINYQLEGSITSVIQHEFHWSTTPLYKTVVNVTSPALPGQQTKILHALFGNLKPTDGTELTLRFNNTLSEPEVSCSIGYNSQIPESTISVPDGENELQIHPYPIFPLDRDYRKRPYSRYIQQDIGIYGKTLHYNPLSNCFLNLNFLSNTEDETLAVNPAYFGDNSDKWDIAVICDSIQGICDCNGDDCINKYNTLDVSIRGTQKFYREDDPNKDKSLEIYDTYKVLKSNGGINYSEYRFFNEWLNTISLDDDAEIDRKIILNKVLTLETDISEVIPPDTDIMINEDYYKTSIKTKPGNTITISGLPDNFVLTESSLTYSNDEGDEVTINITSVNYGDINTQFNDERNTFYDIITGNSEYTVDDDELNLKKFILNLDKSTSYHNLKPLDKLFHTYLGSNKNTLISKEMFIGLNE